MKIFIVTRAEADALPARIGSPYENINSFVLHVNEELEEQNRTLNFID